MADIGLMGKKARVGGEVVEAVDVFLGGKVAAVTGIINRRAMSAVKALENVPCDELPESAGEECWRVSSLCRPRCQT